jgi:indolepyruvate ferredoxin oxidoreductase beta subunit
MDLSTDQVTNVVFAGLGGQGVITASDIFADVAFRAGMDVKKAEIHGMSQRGGSVTSDVRFGRRVLSPMVPPGEADYLLVLTADQVDNNRHALRAGGVLIAPDLIDESKLENKRTFNIAMLGALSHYLELGEELWLAAICARLPEKVHEVNVAAFRFGRDAAAARDPQVKTR